jgi:hypothetical protein
MYAVRPPSALDLTPRLRLLDPHDLPTAVSFYLTCFSFREFSVECAEAFESLVLADTFQERFHVCPDHFLALVRLGLARQRVDPEVHARLAEWVLAKADAGDDRYLPGLLLLDFSELRACELSRLMDPRRLRPAAQAVFAALPDARRPAHARAELAARCGAAEEEAASELSAESERLRAANARLASPAGTIGGDADAGGDADDPGNGRDGKETDGGRVGGDG